MRQTNRRQSVSMTLMHQASTASCAEYSSPLIKPFPLDSGKMARRGWFLIFFHAGWQEEWKEKVEGTRITKSSGFLGYREFCRAAGNFQSGGEKQQGSFRLEMKTCAGSLEVFCSLCPPGAAAKPEYVFTRPEGPPGLRVRLCLAEQSGRRERSPSAGLLSTFTHTSLH